MDIDDGAFLDAVAEAAEAEERRQQKRERKERKRARKEAKRARKEAEAIAAATATQSKQHQNGEKNDGELAEDGEVTTTTARAVAMEEAMLAKIIADDGAAHIGTVTDDELWQFAEIETEEERKRQKRERKERKRARKEAKRARKEAEAVGGSAEAEKLLRKRLKKKSKKRKKEKETEEGSPTASTPTVQAPVEETTKDTRGTNREKIKPPPASPVDVAPRRTITAALPSRSLIDARRDDVARHRSPTIRRPAVVVAATRVRRPYRPLPPRRVAVSPQHRVPVRRKRQPSSPVAEPRQSLVQRRRIVRRSSHTPSPPPATRPRGGTLRPLCARSLSPPTPPPASRVQQQQQRERTASASSADRSSPSRASSKSRRSSVASSTRRARRSSGGRSSSASSSSDSSSSSRSRRSSASSDDSRTYSSDSSGNSEPKKRRTVRSYGPDASSWRMYEKARAEFLQKKLTAGGQVPAHVRDPKLISTLRRPYIPGAGRRGTYGLMRLINGGTMTTGTATTTTVAGTTTTISGLRGRGSRLRGRGGRANLRFFPPRPKADYLDDRGQIDKRKLLEIATENATKLAMEGKLPKGAELVDTIKIKSVEQLATLCKQVAEEEAARPVPFTKWINPDFALGNTGGAPTKRALRPGAHVDNDDDYLLLQKVSSGSEEEGDEEERFQRRHESWKRRTQKAKEAGDEEAEGGDGTTAFKKPLRLLSSEIKIKIAGSTQKSMSSWMQLANAPPLPPVAPLTAAAPFDAPTTSKSATAVAVTTDMPSLSVTQSLSVPMLAAALVRPLPKPPIPPMFSSVSSLLPPPPTPPKLTPLPPKPPLLIRPLPQPPKPPVLIPKQQQEQEQFSNKDSDPTSSANDDQ